MRRYRIHRRVRDPRSNVDELRSNDLLRRRVILWREQVGLSFATFGAGEQLYDPKEEPEEIAPIGLKVNRTRAMIARCFFDESDY